MNLKLPISLGTKSDSDSDYRDLLPENLVIVPKAVDGDDAYLRTHPGITSYSTGQGQDRGAVYNSRLSNHFRISGDKLIEIDAAGAASVISTIPGSTQVSLPYSFQTQGILSGNRFWLYDGTTITEVLDPDLGAPIDVEWINGVYFFTDGETLYHTEAASEFSIEPLDFATSEFSPDRTLGLLKNQQNQMVVFNRFSTEWFVDTGGSGFRFQRIEGKAVKIGIVGTHCKCEMDGQIFVLGNRKEESPSIHILSGGTEQTVASREIDQILETYSESELSSAVLEARVQKRNKYVYVRLARHTLLYNHTVFMRAGAEKAWSILKSDFYETPWRGVNGIYDPRASKWIYGDRNSSDIGYLDDDSFSQYGQQQECVFYSPTVQLEGKSIDSFEINHLPGHTSEDMRMFFSMSYNDVTYGTEYSMPISGLGQYNLRLIKNRLGYIRKDFNFKFRMISSSPMSFTGLSIDYD